MEVMTPAKVFKEPRRHVGGVAPGRPDPAYRAYQILYAGFIAAPLIAGIDKFFHALADWEDYLAPWISGLAGSASGFMKLVGVVEIVAGCLVLLNPRLGGLVVAGWLGGIIVNLLTYPGYYDVALRDFGLMLGALALSQLAREYGNDRRVASAAERGRVEVSGY